MREVIHYKSENGDDPITEFLDSLSGKQAAKVTWVLGLVEDLPIIPKHFSRSLSGLMTSGKFGSISGMTHFGCWVF